MVAPATVGMTVGALPTCRQSMWLHHAYLPCVMLHTTLAERNRDISQTAQEESMDILTVVRVHEPTLGR